MQKMSRARSDKLKDAEYLAYWEQRAARDGLRYVGRSRMTLKQLATQAEGFWSKLRPYAPEPVPAIQTVTEFGCGWGRMTGRLRSYYPDDVAVYGIDMVAESIDLGAKMFPAINFVLGDFYCHEVPPADFLLTCTCLQHITDTGVFQRVVDSFHQRVRPGGTLLMLENAMRGGRNWHLHDMRIADYIDAFHGFTFAPPVIFKDVDPEPHFLLRGTRRDTLR